MANSSCRKNRTVTFRLRDRRRRWSERDDDTNAVVTGPNGDFSATLPPPSTARGRDRPGPRNGSETLRTKVVKGKKKGAGKGKKKGAVKKRKFNCLQGSGDSNVLTTSDGNSVAARPASTSERPAYRRAALRSGGGSARDSLRGQ